MLPSILLLETGCRVEETAPYLFSRHQSQKAGGIFSCCSTPLRSQEDAQAGFTGKVRKERERGCLKAQCLYALSPGKTSTECLFIALDMGITFIFSGCHIRAKIGLMHTIFVNHFACSDYILRYLFSSYIC